ncbi:MAG: GNAT family N-acetyltransferase [Clostridia bacterium]|nr:GNAT family N-acetyltransferase [Clostridia bacterium]
MILEEKKITLKDGRTAVLRSPNPGEGEEQLDLMKTVSAETDFLLRYPEEWNFSVEKEEDWINNARKSQTQLVIAAYVDGELAGNCDISALMGKKSCHRAVIGIALRKKYWNLGIGSALFTEMIAAAEVRGTEILELAFVEGNERGRHLYEKFGFEVYAEKPMAFKMKDGTYRNEFFMQKYMG